MSADVARGHWGYDVPFLVMRQPRLNAMLTAAAAAALIHTSMLDRLYIDLWGNYIASAYSPNVAE